MIDGRKSLLSNHISIWEAAHQLYGAPEPPDEAAIRPDVRDAIIALLEAILGRRLLIFEPMLSRDVDDTTSCWELVGLEGMERPPPSLKRRI